MEEFLLFLNQPVVLWSLFGGAIALILIDYLFPVDWPAYVGYVLFALFIGATADVPQGWSAVTIVAVLGLLLALHIAVFSRFLTNAPYCERRRNLALNSSEAVISESEDQKTESELN